MGHPRWLREEQSTLTPWEKSAEGIVGGARHRHPGKSAWTDEEPAL
jgi:hypothetical protein